jgi:hypothetical protein
VAPLVCGPLACRKCHRSTGEWGGASCDPLADPLLSSLLHSLSLYLPQIEWGLNLWLAWLQQGGGQIDRVHPHDDVTETESCAAGIPPPLPSPQEFSNASCYICSVYFVCLPPWVVASL